MLKNFLHIYEPIKAVINSSKSKAFKNKELLLTNIEITFLNNILKIISIFVKTTTKLQAEKYPTIYYIIPEVYKIYNRLERFKSDFNVSLFFLLFILNTNHLNKIRLLIQLLIKELLNYANIIRKLEL
jgi:hypothetical protein